MYLTNCTALSSYSLGVFRKYSSIETKVKCLAFTASHVNGEFLSSTACWQSCKGWLCLAVLFIDITQVFTFLDSFGHYTPTSTSLCEPMNIF